MSLLVFFLGLSLIGLMVGVADYVFNPLPAYAYNNSAAAQAILDTYVGGPNKIVLIGEEESMYEEFYTNTTITPGMICEMFNNSGTPNVQPHSSRGGKWNRQVAVENALTGLDIVNTQGNSIYDNYTNGNLVRLRKLIPGCVFLAELQVGQNVIIGDWAISNGDGTLIKAANQYLLNNTAASATLTSWTSQVSFSNGVLQIPANQLQVGDILRFRGTIEYVAVNSTNTQNVKLSQGTTASNFTNTLLATGAVNPTNGNICYFDISVEIMTIGTSGTYNVTGFFANNIVPAQVASMALTDVAIFGTAINTTVAQFFTVNDTCSVSNAGNQTVLENFTAQYDSPTLNEQGSGVIGTFEAAVNNTSGSGPARIPVRAI